MIAQLPTDILEEIFLLNAHIFEDRQYSSLRSTISCSHVCSSWRALLLSTPLVWARLLQIDELLHMSEIAREEILARSGTAPLWIARSAALTRLFEEDKVHSFFLDVILRPNWTRIEHFRVSKIGRAHV